MLEHRLQNFKQELISERINEISHFVDTQFQDLEKAEEQYLDQVTRKRNHYLNMIDEIKDKNHQKLRRFHRGDLEAAYIAVKTLDHNYFSLSNIEVDFNTPFYIYYVEGEQYFSYDELDIERMIEDPYSSEYHALILKTWHSSELKKAAYNNKLLFIEKKTSLAECLLNNKYFIHNDEYISKVSNYLLGLKRSGFEVFFDLDVGSSYLDVYKLSTDGLPPKTEITIKNCLIKNSLLQNCSLLNEFLGRGYFDIEKNIDSIISIARDRIYYSDFDDTGEARTLLEPIRTFYLLLKHIDSLSDTVKSACFEKIVYFYEMKSTTKVYNKIFSNREVMILYNKIDKSITPERFEMRQKQERIKKS
ncbi:hypothetical protein [Enterobacter cloacae complex sp. 418I7]|uniref:hypothetical protein n=1 Tax=Enterobacter cloacae complex sp. 418I7 TaxID=3395839 RepID=UPI003CEADBB6